MLISLVDFKFLVLTAGRLMKFNRMMVRCSTVMIPVNYAKWRSECCRYYWCEVGDTDKNRESSGDANVSVITPRIRYEIRPLMSLTIHWRKH